MNVSEAIRARRSIRVFEKKDVEEDKLNRVLAAGRLAPSARNLQEWKFVVVRDRATREKLIAAAKNQRFVGEAPVVIVACATIVDHVMTCGIPSWHVDVPIAVDHMTLQAVEEGLGTCWVCAFDEDKVKQVLDIPAGVRVVTLLPLGYPAEEPAPRHRKALEEIICSERFS